MRIAFVNLYWPPQLTSAAQVMAADETRRELARALTGLGHEVHVVQEGPESTTTAVDGVTWHFHRPSIETRAGRRCLAALGHESPAVLAPATAPLAALNRIDPDIIHSFDLVYYPSLALLGMHAQRRGVPLVAHFHGGDPAHHPLTRPIQQFALARTDAICFTDALRAASWPNTSGKIVSIVETSTKFQPRDRTDARRNIPILGNPAIFCPGRLDLVKDPTTTLRGFAQVLDSLPHAHLTMAYRSETLLQECRASANELGISANVTFMGALPHATMNDWICASDIVVQSSQREVCGVAILEAMACGVPVVVTDIEAFRITTGGLTPRFPIGDAAGLARGILDVVANPIDGAQLRAYFDDHLSYSAMANQLATLYARLKSRPKKSTLGAVKATPTTPRTGV